jgi:hypothetical protein
VSALLSNAAEWEEFQYKWPAACVVSTGVAMVVCVKILFVEEDTTTRSETSMWTVPRTLAWILLPGLLVVGAAYGIAAVCELWFGVVFAFAFVCYVLVLLATRERR